ncbi:MAG: 50S ribosomal protein L9 [Candidatus Peregrinibacteria bacterium]
MEVVLIQDVPKLGHAYDLVKVRPGFARNYLLPQGKASLATPVLIAKAQKIQSERVKKLQEMLAHAKELAEQLRGITLTFKKKVRGETLYGSIGVKDILEALKETAKLEVGKDAIRLEHPIKTVGDYSVTLHLAEGVNVKVAIKVEAET